MLGWTIIGISMFQMGMVGLAPVVSAMTKAFPGTSDLTVQLAATFLNFVLVLVSLCSGFISRHIGRRNMAIAGIGLLVLVAFCGYFFSVALWLVFCWSGLIGIGTGLFVPAVSSMLIDYFDDEQRKTVAGRQTAAVNLGGVLLSLFSGFLASYRWNNAYLIFLGAIPVVFLCFKYLPHEKTESVSGTVRKKGGMRIPPIVWGFTLQTTLFAVSYFTFSTNISLLLAEGGQGSANLAGVAMGCFMLGGGVSGLAFKQITALLKNRTAIGAFVLLAVSYMAIYLTGGLVPLFIAAFFGGATLSIIFPYLLVSISDHIDSGVLVLSTSLVIAVGPNFGSFLSPIIITNLSRLFGSDAVRFRFCLAAVLAMLMAIILLATDTIKRQKVCKKEQLI